MKVIAPHVATRLESAGAACVDRRIGDLAADYSRGRDLRTLHTPNDTLNGAPEGIVRWLARAMRAERAKAISGHWSYSANRHMLLHAALKNERDRITQTKAAAGKASGGEC